MANVDAFKQPESCWRRDRQHTMRGFYSPVSQRDERIVDALDSQQLEAPDGADDIEDRVDRSDLMQMKVVLSDTMDLALDRGNRIERGVRQRSDADGNSRRVDKTMDLRNRPAVGLRRDVKIHFDAVNPSAPNVLDADIDSAETESLRKLSQPGFVESNVDQRSEKHVAGDAAGRIQDRDFHSEIIGEVIEEF